MIDIKKVTKRFGTYTAIEDVSFQVQPCSICGLIGYNGAGKTTLLKTVAGIYEPDEGSVLVDGEKVFDNGVIRRQLFYIPDDLYFPMNATVKWMERFYAGYYPTFDHATFQKLLDIFRLDRKARIRGFSKGMQRQLEIALGLSVGAVNLLLDESFDGLDPEKRNITKKLLLEYMAERECAMVISSHNLNEVADLCDQITLLDGKKVKINQPIDDLKTQYAKFKLVFDREVANEFFDNIACKELKVGGKIATLTATGDIQKIQTMLEALRPLSLERYNMTLEEIFLSEMEEREYETESIFRKNESL